MMIEVSDGISKSKRQMVISRVIKLKIHGLELHMLMQLFGLVFFLCLLQKLVDLVDVMSL